MDYKTLSIPELKVQWEELNDDFKFTANAILEALEAKSKSQLEAVFVNKGKISGDVTQPIEGVKLKYEVSKRIDWDSEKLKEAALLVPADKVNGIFTSKLSVSEKVFSVLSTLLDADNPALAKIIEARTVKLGEAKVTFAKDAA